MANTPNNPQRNAGEFGATGSRFNPTGGTQGQHGTATGTASSFTEQAKGVASSVADQAKDLASSVQQRAGDIASNIGDKAQDAMHAVGDTWEAGRRYVSEQGFSGMAEDLTTVIRRNPIPAILIGFGLGFLLARTMKD